MPSEGNQLHRSEQSREQNKYMQQIVFQGADVGLSTIENQRPTELYASSSDLPR